MSKGIKRRRHRYIGLSLTLSLVSVVALSLPGTTSAHHSDGVTAHYCVDIDLTRPSEHDCTTQPWSSGDLPEGEYSSPADLSLHFAMPDDLVPYDSDLVEDIEVDIPAGTDFNPSVKNQCTEAEAEYWLNGDDGPGLENLWWFNNTQPHEMDLDYPCDDENIQKDAQIGVVDALVKVDLLDGFDAPAQGRLINAVPDPGDLAKIFIVLKTPVVEPFVDIYGKPVVISAHVVQVGDAKIMKVDDLPNTAVVRAVPQPAQAVEIFYMPHMNLYLEGRTMANGYITLPDTCGTKNIFIRYHNRTGGWEDGFPMFSGANQFNVVDCPETYPPFNTGLPTISGTAKVGETLTAHNGSWDGNPIPDVVHVWQRCDSDGNNCNDLTGTEDHPAYTLIGADEGHRMRVKETATNSEGSASVRSEPTDPVAPPDLNERPVIVSGGWAMDAVNTMTPWNLTLSVRVIDNDGVVNSVKVWYGGGTDPEGNQSEKIELGNMVPQGDGIYTWSLPEPVSTLVPGAAIGFSVVAYDNEGVATSLSWPHLDIPESSSEMTSQPGDTTWMLTDNDPGRAHIYSASFGESEIAADTGGTVRITACASANTDTVQLYYEQREQALSLDRSGDCDTGKRFNSDLPVSAEQLGGFYGQVLFELKAKSNDGDSPLWPYESFYTVGTGQSAPSAEQVQEALRGIGNDLDIDPGIRPKVTEKAPTKLLDLIENAESAASSGSNPVASEQKQKVSAATHSKTKTKRG